MNDELIKQAFQKAKEDIFYLGQEIANARQEILDLQTEFKLISKFIEDLKLKQLENKQNELAIFHKNNQISDFQADLQQTNQQTDIPTHEISQFPTQSPTFQHINPTQTTTPTDNPTLPHEIGGLISPYTGISIGNRGVPTDKPTNRQTNQQTGLSSVNSQSSSLDKAGELLASLDSLKKEVRFKFKRLTTQEMQVFSLLYNLEESGIIVDYKILAEKLALSESSIRDYVGKIQKKGIPITKEKLNNKRILLHISPELKQIASLNTILKLREI